MTTTAKPKNELVELVPYLFFYGRCEEALEFYKGVLGGTVELKRYSEIPIGQDLGPEFQDKIMHSRFEAPGIVFMASDGNRIQPVEPDSGNISLSLTVNDRAKAEQIFQAFAQGGTIGMPLEEVPWGGRFGMVTDRFATEWLVSTT